jgi:hypothetical protein
VPLGRCYSRRSSKDGHGVSGSPSSPDERAIVKTHCRIAQANKARRGTPRVAFASFSMGPVVPVVLHGTRCWKGGTSQWDQ